MTSRSEGYCKNLFISSHRQTTHFGKRSECFLLQERTAPFGETQGTVLSLLTASTIGGLQPLLKSNRVLLQEEEMAQEDVCLQESQAGLVVLWPPVTVNAQLET